MIVLLLLLLKHRRITINDRTSYRKFVLILRSDIGRFANAWIHNIMLTDVWVPVRMLLWRCNYHRAIMIRIVVASKVLILRLVSTTWWIWTQAILQIIEELSILFRVTSWACIGAATANIWTLHICVFSILEHTTNLVKVAIRWTKLIYYNSTYDRLQVRILEHI